MSRTSDWTRVLPFGLVAAVVLGGVVLADSPPAWYEIEALPPISGTERCPAYSNATGINELGHVVGLAEVGEDIIDQWGNWIDCRFLNHAVIWRDGELVDLGFPQPDVYYANGKGINDYGQVVGQMLGQIPGRSGYYGMPFLWTEGVGWINPAEELEWPTGQAWGINNAGQVALSTFQDGYFWDPVDGLRRIHFPDDPGTRSGSTAWEINNEGLVCGAAPQGSDPYRFLHAYRYDSWTDTITDLHDPYYRHSGAYGLNDRGDVGGWIEAYTNHVFAALWKRDGESIMVPLDDPEFAYARAEHVNSYGIMVGRSLGRDLPRRLLGWVAFEAPDRMSDFPANVRPIGSGGDGTTIVINPRPGPHSIRKIALYDLLSDEDSAAWDRLTPFEINDAGQIVGLGVYNGATRGFVMTPRFWVEIVLEEATSTALTVAAPASAEASRLATAHTPDVDAVISASREQDGLVPVGRFSPLLARHGRRATGEIVTTASGPALPLDPRSSWKDCEPEDRGCIYGVDAPDSPVADEPGPGETPPPAIPDVLGSSGPKLETNR